MTTSFACKSTTCLSPAMWAISNFLFLSKKKIQEWSCVCQCCSYIFHFCLVFSIKNVLLGCHCWQFFLFCTPHLSPHIPKSCTPSPHLPTIHKIYSPLKWNVYMQCITTTFSTTSITK